MGAKPGHRIKTIKKIFYHEQTIGNTRSNNLNKIAIGRVEQNQKIMVFQKRRSLNYYLKKSHQPKQIT